MKELIAGSRTERAYSALRFNALFVSALLVNEIRVQAAFNVTQTSAANVVATLIPPSSGLTTSSISAVGQSQQRGTFTASSSDNIGGSINGLTNGAILSSGDVSDAQGPNDSDSTGNTVQFPEASDPALESFINQGSSQGSFDVSSITFTVTNPTADTARIALYYTFASEEFPEFIEDLKNDGAYIMVDGTLLSTVEVADADFNDNSSSQVWEYDGYTDVAAVVIEIPSGRSKVIKILVGDGDDWVYDSAFLIQSRIEFGCVPVFAVKLATLPASEGWTPYPFLTAGCTGPCSQWVHSTTSNINTDGLQNPAPQPVYQHLQTERSTLTWTANNLSPGTYKVRVHLSSIEFPGDTQVSETLTVTDASNTYSISGVTPYGSGGYNLAMIVQFPQDFTPNASCQISGSIIQTSEFAVVSGVEIVKNP